MLRVLFGHEAAAGYNSYLVVAPCVTTLDHFVLDDNFKETMTYWATVEEALAVQNLGPTVVTIGNFDGVHRGHQAVMDEVTIHAEAAGLHPVVVTFDPHPVSVVRPELAPPRLTTIEYRVELLKAAGAADVLVLPFDEEMSRWSPEEFIDRVLIDALRARDVVVGQDFRFGSRGSGTVHTLRAYGAHKDMRVQVIDDERSESRRWSSTWARDLIQAGDVVRAREVLGRPHRIDGHVVTGDKRGRELGYPTANVASEVLAPRDGVYAGWLVQLDQDPQNPDYRLPAAISVGTNPTFDGQQRRVEAHVLGRDDLALYDALVGVEVVERLRGMERFDSVDALCAAMDQDVALAEAILLED